jgi:hypothetical protein
MAMVRPGVLVFVFLSACSSIPDVQFVEPSSGDAQAPVGTSLTGGLGDGGADDPRDAAVDAAVYHCPDRPPPAAVGVCCDALLCLKCTASHCGRCKSADCDADQICCAKNSANVDCKKQQSCE